MTQITNKELVKLDEQVSQFYKLSHRYLNSLANLYGREVYKKELSPILNEADKIKPESEFDELIIKNIKSNIGLNNLVFEYITNPNSHLTTNQFFDKISGGAFNFLEDRVKKPLWEERWKITEKMQEREYARVSPFTEEAQNAARSWIPKIKEDVLRYGKAEEILPEEFDMTMLLLPPREGGESSNWNSATKVFSLGSYGFDFLYRNNAVVAIPVSAYTVSFHEVLGHGAINTTQETCPCL